ncbi:MAG: alpha-L-fucosidase [Candidatus Bathyarchaeia archaeon]
MNRKKWFERSYRRNLVDMHIEDWDQRFLSKLNPEKYVAMLKLANIKSTMIYANSHVGYCYWSTKTGHMHRGLGGKDFLDSMIKLCHEEGIDVIVYYSLIYNNWAYEQYPKWRIIDINGKQSRDNPGQGGRYGVCCPNSEYRNFVTKQIEELCRNYKFEGIFFDMTFWPTVCYCPNCKKRYMQEEENLPTIIDWNDPQWLKFQKKREKWLSEFAAMATGVVKKIKPEVTVEHQSSTLTGPWIYGVTSWLNEQCDWVDGDFYGGYSHQSFICKLFYNLTPKMPFVYSTSICYPNLHDHTTTKPKELTRTQAFLTIAHNGAFLIIDAIDPTGTLEKRRYQIIGDVFNEIAKYEEHLGGELCQDVAVYFSFNSKFNPNENGKSPSPEVINKYSWILPHLDAALGCTETLRTYHVPFGIITIKNFKELPRHRVVVLPNVLKLSEEESKAIIDYVAEGGNIYASKFSLKSKLSQMLGVSFIEETHEKFTYIAPTSNGENLFSEITEKYPLSISDSQMKINLESKGDVLAKIMLPYTDPDDSSKFASIHSNPPRISTNYPALIYKKIGKGRAILSSASLETFAIKSLRHRAVFMNIIRALAKNHFSFEATAPQCVEIVLFRKPDEKTYLINVVNLQSEIGIPNVPVNNIRIKIKVKSKTQKVLLMPERKPIPFVQRGEYVKIRVPKLQAFRMLTLKYE